MGKTIPNTVLLLNNTTLRFYDLEELKRSHNMSLIALVSPSVYKTLPSEFIKQLRDIIVVECREHEVPALTEFPFDSIERVFLHERARHPNLVLCASDEMNSLNAALLREKYGMLGTPSYVIRQYRHKNLQKQVLQKAGIRVPRFCRVSTTPCTKQKALYHTIRDAVGDNFVLKPATLAGTLGVEQIDSLGAFQSYIEKTAANIDILAEEFIQGQLYHVDFILSQGRYLFEEVCEYVWNGLSFISGKNHGSIMLPRKHVLRNKILSFARKANDALGFTSGCVHMEVFVTSGEEIVFLEAGPRPAGSLVPYMYTQIFGLSLMNSALLADLNRSQPKFDEPNLRILGSISTSRGTYLLCKRTHLEMCA